MARRVKAMNIVGASIARYFERIIAKIKAGTAKISRSPPTALEYILVKIVRIGRKLETSILNVSMKLAVLADKVQKSLYESALLTSLYIGLLLTLALLVVIIYNIVIAR